MKKLKLIFITWIVVLTGFIAGCTDTQTMVKEKIDKINYVTVDLQQSGVKMDLNLATKKMYGYKYAIENDTVYDFKTTYQSKSLGFNYFKKINLLYPILADQTRVGTVKQSNYVIVKDVKNHPEQRKIINIWHDDGFKGYKVKIFYNHDCLPIKVQLIDRETKKWKTITKYSYPHISSKQYERNWKKYVKEVKAGYYLD